MSIAVTCPDADAAVAQARDAGATVLAPVQDSFSGDRHGLIRCPYGYRWILTTWVQELAVADVERRFRQWAAAGSPAGPA